VGAAVALPSLICLLSAIAMTVGALGPWVEIGPFTGYGSDGIGLPIVLVAIAASSAAVPALARPRRPLFVVLGLLGATTVAMAIVAWVVVGASSGAGHLIVLLLARHLDLQQLQGQPVTARWGLWWVSVAAVAMTVAAGAGVLTTTGSAPARGRDALPGTPHPQPTAPEPPTSGADDTPPWRWR